MTEDLEAIQKSFTLTEAEKDQVDTEGALTKGSQAEEGNWLMAKLITRRSFNKKALMSTMKIIWRLSKDAEALVLDEKLFLFKFANKKDKQRVLDGSPWSFQKNLLAFTNYDGDLRTSKYEFKRACFWIRALGCH